MTYEIQKFDGSSVEITPEQKQKIEPLLLATGKFVLVDGEILNISEIKNIKKIPMKDHEYDYSKIVL